MVNRIKILLLLAILSTQSVSISTLAQNPAEKQPPNQDRPLKLRTDEVVVDVVVLDKKNRPVDSLTADDFEIFENETKQRVISFRHEATSSADLTATGQDVKSRPSSALPNLVSLVFDAQTTRDGALRARKAAFDYIDSGMGPNDYVAVFGIDLGLMIL